MNTVRLFTGTYADPEIFRFLYHELQKEFKPVLDGKWVEPENLHFTYKFIGDFNSAFIGQLKNELSDVLRDFNDKLELCGIDCFPKNEPPRVMHIGIKDTNGVLNRIFEKIESVAVRHGVPREKFPFTPHLTLVRIKSVKKELLDAKLEEFRNKSFGIMNGFRVSLIESKLYDSGPLYKEM
jgi:2'-5' RNA ligase